MCFEVLCRVKWRSFEFLSVRALLQLLLYFICHTCWDVRKVAYDATRKIVSSSMKLSAELLLQYRNWFPIVSDRSLAMKLSDMESRLDSQIAIVPPAEVLAKCLLLIAPAAMACSGTFSMLIFCACHPYLAGAARSDAVWKDLFGFKGLLSSNSLEQISTLYSLSTLMRITPNETFSEFTEGVRHSATKAAETVVLVVDEDGIEALLSELLKGVADNHALMRRGSCYLIGYFFSNSKLYLVDETPEMISTLIVLLTDSDPATVMAAWQALGRVMSSVPKEIISSYIKLVRDAVSTARDKERRKRKGGQTLIPGFSLPKALQPLLPIFLQGLISGSAETREQAAEGLGELIDVTSEQTLKDFVVPITGPLIRIIGDRFPWQVKGAILSTLSIIISKGGIALRPFLPQLQTTFIKCLQDSTRTVRTSAALALGKLSALSNRVDPLVGDLLSTLQVSNGGIREAVLTALRGVIRHSGKSVSNIVRCRLCILLRDMIQVDVDEVRESAAKVIGTMSKYLEHSEVIELLQTLSALSTSPNWYNRHGAMLTLSSMALHAPSMICQSSLFPSIMDDLRSSLRDDKFPVRETAIKALGRLLYYEAKNETQKSTSADLLGLLILALLDISSDVRRRSLSSIKAAAKVNHSIVMANISNLGPSIAECLKDTNMPVRLAAERCALHVFLLTKGADYVQAAQKYLTGLDARRLSKLSENSDDSGNSEDEAVNTS